MDVDMPTLHIRNVPIDLYEKLRDAAEANSRSLNAEVIALLEQATHSWQGDPDFLAEFEAIRAVMRAAIVAGAPQPDELPDDERLAS